MNDGEAYNWFTEEFRFRKKRIFTRSFRDLTAYPEIINLCGEMISDLCLGEKKLEKFLQHLLIKSGGFDRLPSIFHQAAYFAIRLKLISQYQDLKKIKEIVDTIRIPDNHPLRTLAHETIPAANGWTPGVILGGKGRYFNYLHEHPQCRYQVKIEDEDKEKKQLEKFLFLNTSLVLWPSFGIRLRSSWDKSEKTLEEILKQLREHFKHLLNIKIRSATVGEVLFLTYCHLLSVNAHHVNYNTIVAWNDQNSYSILQFEASKLIRINLNGERVASKKELYNTHWARNCIPLVILWEEKEPENI